MKPVTVALVVGVVCIKAVLYWMCARRHTSNGDVLAMDQRNDVITNTVALLGALVGTHLWPYADPLGAIGVWSVTENFLFIVLPKNRGKFYYELHNMKAIASFEIRLRRRNL